MSYYQRRRPGAEFGGTKKFFADMNDIYPKKFPFENFSRPFLFLVIDQVFQILCFFTVLNVVYDPFFTRKTTISKKEFLDKTIFFTLSVLSRASDNTTSLNIGGGRPLTFNFWGTGPKSPLGLRPCILWSGSSMSLVVFHSVA